MGKNVTVKANTEEVKAIVEESAQSFRLTKEGQKFLSLYSARKDAGKDLARVGQGLRALKSAETKAFWAEYAVLSTGFGGTEVFKAPAFDKAIFEERLKALGWPYKRFPTAQKIHAKKHGLVFGECEKAFLDQEEAARAAAKKEKPVPEFSFAEETIKDVLSFVSDDNPAGIVLESLAKQIRKKLADM